MEKDKHIYFDLDSDALRILSEIDKETKDGIYFDYTTSKIPLVRKYFGYFYSVLQAAKNDYIRLSIGNTIFHENNYSKTRLEFMKKYCYFPNIDMVNCCDKLAEVEKLANLYCLPYKKSNIEYDAPLQKIYNAAIQKITPSNDAYAMADAVVWGSNFLTANGQDLTFNKYKPQAGNIRTKGIIEINKQNGYFDSENNETSKPICISVLGPIIKNHIDTMLFIKTNDSTKVKADKILE